MILAGDISKNWGKWLHIYYYFFNYMSPLIYTFIEQLLTCLFPSDLAGTAWHESV